MTGGGLDDRTRRNSRRPGVATARHGDGKQQSSGDMTSSPCRKPPCGQLRDRSNT